MSSFDQIRVRLLRGARADAALAIGVFVLVAVIRCLIVPAVMQMLGKWAWWMPAPLARRTRRRVRL